ncbi:MAG: asparaginase [Propionibacteriaceae bacterium]|nr:asparaginase [Propionibacteriaceae bacterium]
MTRIQILYTGGTVGMVDSPRGLVLSPDLPSRLEKLLADTDLTCSVTHLERLIDSSNSVPEDWQAIVDAVHAHADDADAFVVVHGTDTMAYATAALSYALTGIRQPVVVTGAQLPLASVGSDAPANIISAVRAAASPRSHGVSLFFGSSLLAGNRASKVSSWSNEGFTSPNQPPLARIGTTWHWNPAPDAGCGWPDPRRYERQDVMVIDMCPGITARRLQAMLDPAPTAVIIRAYGVGGVPSDEPGLIRVIQDLVADDVPVVVASQCLQADVQLGYYETGRALREVGAVGCADMTVEAAYAKTVFLLSQGLAGADLAAWIGVNIAGELTETTPGDPDH